jgi:hypothetical protein
MSGRFRFLTDWRCSVLLYVLARHKFHTKAINSILTRGLSIGKAECRA